MTSPEPDPGGFDDLHARINASAAIYQNLYANYAAAITDAAPGTLDQVLATLDPIMAEADAVIDGLAAELAGYTAGIAARMVDDAGGYAAEAARIQAAAGGTLSPFELAARITEPAARRPGHDSAPRGPVGPAPDASPIRSAPDGP